MRESLNRFKIVLTLVIALVVAALDLGSKRLALETLSPVESLRITDFFNLVLVKNQGAAFSIFSADGPKQGVKMALLALGAMIPLFWFYRQAASKDRLLLAALGLIVGGAAGNIHDRLRYNGVVDFLDFHWGDNHWPAFNVADIGICVGVGLLALSVFFGKRPGDRAENRAKKPGKTN
ncbi:MAG: signal peptidase II [Deltaproteobacteria bacterium]|nr:signal peptidase II [Deltaproteobacteria bacterium]